MIAQVHNFNAPLSSASHLPKLAFHQENLRAVQIDRTEDVTLLNLIYLFFNLVAQASDVCRPLGLQDNGILPFVFHHVTICGFVIFQNADMTCLCFICSLASKHLV